MKKTASLLLTSFSLVTFIVFVFVATTNAATSATVNATVTVQNISVSVSDGSISYGTLAADDSQDTIALSDTQTATNEGNVSQDLNISGANTASWTLSASNGEDQYVHQFSVNAGSSWTALTTNPQTLVADLAADGTRTFDLQITTPQTTSSFEEQTVVVTVQAVAAN